MINKTWHSWVAQPKKSQAWHESDIADELAELHEASSFIEKWSELSDVVYTVTRARWSGHKFEYPIPRHKVIAGHVYMYPKYSSRVIFYRIAGRKAGAVHTIQCVRNPKKAHKIQQIAHDNNVDPEQFIKICQKQRKFWPLLP